MTRPTKQTVDYFPHFVMDSKTKSVLKSRYGNNGYAFWFQLLELLCKTDEHYYNCTSVTDWEYLLAWTSVSEGVAIEVLNLLSEMGKIDAELWTGSKVIWCPSLLSNLEPVYAKRRVDRPTKPDIDTLPAREPDVNGVSDTDNPQSIVEESIGENTLVNEASFIDPGVSSNGNKSKKPKPVSKKGTEHPKSVARLRAKDEDKRTAGEKVFLHWVDRMEKRDDTLYDGVRRAKCQQRLDKDSTPEDLMAAIDGCRASPHNMGENDRDRTFNDLELICRSRDNVEKFREMAPDQPSGRTWNAEETKTIREAVKLLDERKDAEAQDMCTVEVWREVVARYASVQG